MPMKALRLATMILALLVSASAAHAFSASDLGTALPKSVDATRLVPPLTLIKKRCGPLSIVLEGRCIKKSEAANYCGPGYRVRGDRCVQGAYEASPKKSPSCPEGQIWSAEEGCHYDD